MPFQTRLVSDLWCLSCWETGKLTFFVVFFCPVFFVWDGTDTVMIPLLLFGFDLNLMTPTLAMTSTRYQLNCTTPTLQLTPTHPPITHSHHHVSDLPQQPQRQPSSAKKLLKPS
jgi:hypothetical protein